MKISVCIPTYKSTGTITETLDSILSQSMGDFEVVICNNSPEDHIALKEILDSYDDLRIKFYPNKRNLGYPLNLQKCVRKSKNNIIFLMGSDDVILGFDVFKKIVEIYKNNPEIGVITRPYYWFDNDVNIPIRYIPKCDRRVISLNDDKKYIGLLIETLGQLSGLVYRKDLITSGFNEHVFTAHIYPFLSILKTHKCYFWENFNIAVRTSSSQTRTLSYIYNPSPTKTWVEMFKNVFIEKKFNNVKNICVDYITSANYVGLVQIKNYGYYKDLLADIFYLIKYRKRNLVNLKFWFYVIGVLLIPRFILRRLVDLYKNSYNKKRLFHLVNGKA